MHVAPPMPDYAMEPVHHALASAEHPVPPLDLLLRSISLRSRNSHHPRLMSIVTISIPRKLVPSMVLLNLHILWIMHIYCFISSLSVSQGRKEFKFAIKVLHWLTAMREEMDVLRSSNTWDLVHRPSNENVVSSKWVFRTKFKLDGSIERYKVRLVAQGFTQIPKFDFSHTFSPVVHAATVRGIFVVVVHRRWSLHQLDVKNAFLHGVLDKHVLMAQPPGFLDPRFPHHVCR